MGNKFRIEVTTTLEHMFENRESLNNDAESSPFRPGNKWRPRRHPAIPANCRCLNLLFAAAHYSFAAASRRNPREVLLENEVISALIPFGFRPGSVRKSKRSKKGLRRAQCKSIKASAAF